MAQTEATSTPWVRPEESWRPPDAFGLRLVHLRKHLKLSSVAIAALCDLKPSTWASWETGARPQDLIGVVNKIVAATGVDRDWLLFGDTSVIGCFDEYAGQTEPVAA